MKDATPAVKDSQLIAAEIKFIEEHDMKKGSGKVSVSTEAGSFETARTGMSVASLKQAIL